VCRVGGGRFKVVVWGGGGSLNGGEVQNSI